MAGAAATLDAWLEVRAAGGLAVDAGPLLVRVRKGGQVLDAPMTGDAIAKRVAYLADRAGVEAFSPHDLRRSFATTGFRLGVDGATMQRILGHARFETTLAYDRRSDEDAAEAVAVMSFPVRGSGIGGIDD